MKKLYLLMAGAFLFGSSMAADVTFSVDMTGQTVDASGVHIAGSFQSEIGLPNDWTPNGTALVNQGNGIWSITVNIPAGYYEYKFINGASWGKDESPATLCNINGNRAVSVGASTLAIPTTLFGQCAGTSATVVFQVSMKGQSFINPNGIHVAGDFQNEAGYAADWAPGESRMYDQNDSIYKLAVTLPAGSYQYKFVNGNSWGDDESVPSACATNNNRSFTMDGSVALNLTAVNFGQCPPGIVFNVDMSGETGFTMVSLAGSFNGWDVSATPMINGGSGIWSVTVQLSPDNYEYKFVKDGQYENVPAICSNNGGNRQITVTGGASIAAVKFGACRPRLTLSVDLSNETVSPDGVHVAGDFQGWNPAGTPMTDKGNGIFEATIEVDAGSYGYKFINGNAWGKDESVPGACNTNGNRSIVVPASDLVVQTVCFKQCDWPCKQNPDPADVTFRVDMSGQGFVVDPSGIWIMGSFTTPAWQDGRVQLTDSDNDSVYEVTLNISGPAEIQYKFSNGEPVSGSAFQDGETGDFLAGGCGVGNGIGGFNRILTRTGSAQVLNIVSYNSCERLASSITGFNGNLFKIFPNPAQDVVNIQLEGQNSKVKVVLLDLNGKTMIEQLVEGSAKVSTKDVASGAYIVKLLDLNSGAIAYQKLIIQ